MHAWQGAAFFLLAMAGALLVRRRPGGSCSGGFAICYSPYQIVLTPQTAHGMAFRANRRAAAGNKTETSYGKHQDRLV